MQLNISINKVTNAQAAAIETYLELLGDIDYNSRVVPATSRYAAVYATDGAGGWDLYFVVSDLLIQDDPTHLDGIKDDNEYFIVGGDCHTQFPHKLDSRPN